MEKASILANNAAAIPPTAIGSQKPTYLQGMRMLIELTYKKLSRRQKKSCVSGGDWTSFGALAMNDPKMGRQEYARMLERHLDILGFLYPAAAKKADRKLASKFASSLRFKIFS